MVDPIRIELLGAIVLAGGVSRRMGEPKALLRFGDTTLVERVVERVSRVCASVVVVAQQGLSLPLFSSEVRVVRDPLVDGGPLVGLAEGLDALSEGTPWAFVCAVDGPFVSPVVVERLYALREKFEAVVPRLDGDAYPLTALYARALSASARALVDAGERRARVLSQLAHTRWVSREDLLAEPRVVRADPRLATFFNVFPGGTVWSNNLKGDGYDLVLIGQESPGPINVDQMQQRLDRLESLLVQKERTAK